MINVYDQLDAIEENVMSGLKDFQRATVERIDHLYQNHQRRVLVSDEVGLGKTLIARGTVAKFAKLRKKEGDDLVKVVYICSNAAIAEQNLAKLRITSEARVEAASSSRLSMQHLNVTIQENDPDLLSRYIQLIPLTPDTSFRMTSGTGTVSERALMFAHLRRLSELSDYLPELDIAMMDNASATWKNWCRDYHEKAAAECNDISHGQYYTNMDKSLHEELHEKWHDDLTYMDGLVELCKAIRENNGKRVKNTAIIGQLRVIFAKISLEKLDPDLVIMDEFQRFRYLLDSDPNSETGMLANKFFHAPDVRMLLLSATPYKMYSTPEEIDETHIDEHYTEFLSVMEFLNEDPTKENEFLEVWRNYSIKLKEMTIGDTTILSAKKAAEDAMYQSVCRTERITAAENADIIDDSDVHVPLTVLEEDIRSYLQAQEVLDQIGANYHVPVDYVKSTPYLMSFMRDYQLKKNVEKYFESHPGEIKTLDKDTLWLDRETIDNYKLIPNNNARLERIMRKALEQGDDKLLWVPPSKPYYELQGAYEGKDLFSKTLVFSSWEMVPRMLASLISYEAERRTVGKMALDRHEREGHYFHDEKKRYPPARLEFKLRKDRESSMTLFCLLYPSRFLSKCYDPIACMNKGYGIREIRILVRDRIQKEIKKYNHAKVWSSKDPRWFYLAPLLLDDPKYVIEWLDSTEKLISDEIKEGKQNKAISAHLRKLRALYEETRNEQYKNLGKFPDDLLDVLTDMAIASPAICIKRTYNKYLAQGQGFPLSKPTQLARAFVDRMNSPESTAVVELACGRKTADAHWQNVLTYCRQGNLQAVFDEYAHLISSGLDLDDNLIIQLHDQMKDSLNLRATPYIVDTYNNFTTRANRQKDSPIRIRTHYAVAFTKGEGRESDTQRKITVRNAFNSPFRPFVLATTSIGQEGLDFHNYCRRIVHWNLPSNPIDLEQREGRINRFECLAIRQNIAKRYGKVPHQENIWEGMFEKAAEVEKKTSASDLIPFWGLSETEDMVKIERIVPMYPYSRDTLSYERLIKILSLYRLTLGQARQEELLEYLFKNCEDEDKLKELFINLSPFYKEKGNM